MKIDKTSIRHRICLLQFGLNVMLAIAWRPFRRHRPRKQVVLYGHKLTGNLLAIFKYLHDGHEQGFETTVLTLDPQYYPRLQAMGVPSVLATRLECARLLSRADALISDHGLPAMARMLLLSNMKFFDVWHGIPYKGFDADDFRVERRYDETWVASPLLARLQVERFGFAPEKTRVTGYARTDRLVRRDEDTDAIRREFGLDAGTAGKIVLFAPTWTQDARNRSLLPFGVDEQTFFRSLSELAQRTGSTFVMRAHLNSGKTGGATFERIVQRPHAEYPDTEALLLVSDILVCDWSSISFDFLLLERPTLFLDVQAPFAKGFSLGPEYRFGEIIPDMAQLLRSLEHYLRQPSDYLRRFGERVAQIREAVYADQADGHASARCVERLRRHLMPPAEKS